MGQVGQQQLAGLQAVQSGQNMSSQIYGSQLSNVGNAISAYGQYNSYPQYSNSPYSTQGYNSPYSSATYGGGQ
jgi:hypothetical protein